MQFGYFDEENREYVITDPHTPVKWINYLGTLSFGGFVDHTGGSQLCRNDPALNRITKYIPQLPAADFRGETLYLRIKEAEQYRTFSAYFTPTLDPYHRYECRVGLGYTRIISELFGLRCDTTIFVPRGEAREIRDIRITNLRDTSLEIDAIPVVEFSHPDALKQLTNADWVPQTMTARAIRKESGEVLIIQYPFMYRDIRVNFFTSNRPVSSFETDRRVFLGANEYSGWARPGSLLQPELSDSEVNRGDPVAALMHHLGRLAPGETTRLITQLGQEDNSQPDYQCIEQFRQPGHVEAAFGDLKTFWSSYLERQQVQTPDASMNRMLNVHNPRQCYITKNWSRYLSLYQLGYGSSRGIGVRDSSQDILGILSNAPDEGRELLRSLLHVQKRNGSAMHQFNPLTMVGSEGDSLEREEGPHYYSDDHLWCVLAATEYVKETGDRAFLTESIPFYDKDKAGQPIEQASVLDHLQRAVDFTRQDLGKHGLPLLGFADWNDTVNLQSGAESLFTANLYGRALLELAALYDWTGLPTAASACKEDWEKMRATVNHIAWDGSWYIRYFDADGSPLGSSANPYGQIFVNAQSWSILSNFATKERGLAAMDAVHERLNTIHGIKLSTPGFNGFDPSRGGVTTYPPGAKENGGIFLHANPWAIIAETILGRGDRAFQYYNQINPAARNESIEVFECEPYVYPQNILGDEHPQFGLARNSWLTGTASWAYVAATRYILGVRPTYDGLVVDPCIPSSWPGFIVHRRFRNALYHILVENPAQINRGVSSLTVDGQRILGNIAPIFSSGEHTIKIMLGS